MKRIFTLLLVLAAMAPALAQVEKNLVHDGNAEVRNHSGYTSIDMSGAIDLYLSQGTEDAVAVSASSGEIISRIRTEMRGNRLRIYFDGKGLNWKKWGNHKMKAYVTFKNLNSIEASGACNVKVSGKIKTSQLKIEMSGASDFKGDLEVSNLKLEASGASRITVNGFVKMLGVNANGASDIRGYDISAEQCKVDASGASVVRVTVNKELNATASGASAIYYKGEGLIRDINTSGGATVKRKSND
ncbi:MAG: head GIN domain-containing protein [Bacteroidota bacterium]